MHPSGPSSKTLGVIFFCILALASFSISHAAIGSYKDLNTGDQQKLGGCTKDPYPILRQRYQPGPQSAREGADGINKLNPDFACRLSRFLEKFPSICIRSAYRSTATQAVLWQGALKKYGSAAAARKWVAPPGSSMHNKGLAADLCNVPGNARAAAGQDGLTFRMGHEPWHIEPAGAVKGETPTGNDASNGPPSSGISDAARNFFGGGQQATPLAAPTQSQEMCALPDGMQVPCSSIANRGGAPVGSAQGTPVGNPPPTLPASQQIGQYLQASSPAASPGSGSALSVSERTEKATSSKKVSAIEQIEAIAEPTGTAGETDVSGILLLSLDAKEARRLADEQARRDASTTEEASQGDKLPRAEQTFTSSALKSDPAQAAYRAEQLTGLQSTLSALKEMLLVLIEYLKPFNGPSADHNDELVE